MRRAAVSNSPRTMQPTAVTHHNAEATNGQFRTLALLTSPTDLISLHAYAGGDQVGERQAPCSRRVGRVHRCSQLHLVRCSRCTSPETSESSRLGGPLRSRVVCACASDINRLSVVVGGHRWIGSSESTPSLERERDTALRVRLGIQQISGNPTRCTDSARYRSGSSIDAKKRSPRNEFASIR